MALFDSYRKSLGETRDLFDAPGHLFDNADLDRLECLLDLVLYFYWDAILIDGTATLAVSASHDEWVSLHAKAEADLSQMQQEFESLKLKRLGS